MLTYHVEYKEFSPLLAKRSLKIFLDQFDPSRLYFLQAEVAPFIDMKEEGLKKIVTDHEKSSYETYESIDFLIRSAILRARARRAILTAQFVEKGVLESEENELGGNFCKTEKDLSENVKKSLIAALEFEKKAEGLTQLSSEDIKSILDLFEKRVQKSEDEYLAPDEGRFLSMQIIKAFAKSLDPHSCFFTSEESLELKMILEKQFEGIGIVFREGIRGISVKSLVEGGPAKRSGVISEGDLLKAINNRSVQGISYREAMNLLKESRGGKVLLTFSRKEGGVFSVTLVREKIALVEEKVRFTSYPYADGMIGVINLPSFYENGDGISAEKDIKNAIRTLKSQGNLIGLVLDVRDNTGGFLSQAVKVSGLFISSGVIVISKYADNQIQYLREINGKMFYRGPLVVLTSKLSASATEILAQALQDYGIALVVGDHRTYGKGTIQYQTVTEDGAESFFKVTIGRYYTVSGRSTQIEGVKADIIVPTKYAPFNIGEKYLAYPLKNDQVSSAFIDSCADVDLKNLAWFESNYLPNLQKKISSWNAMLPILKKNSQYRLNHDQNFLAFLRLLQSKPSLTVDWKEELGSEDLQMNEALAVIKDMTLLQKDQKTGDFLRK